MKGILVNAAFLVAGAAVGSLVTWKVVETKYKKISEEEINSVKEHYRVKVYGDALAEGFRKGVENVNDIVADNVKEEAVKVLKECEDILEHANYITYSKIEEKGGPDTTVYDKPYVIEPEECGELAGYDVISLTHFNDGVLTDDDYNKIDNVDEIVGADYHEHFGEYEDDSVFIRNDAKQCDYEILADTRNYTDVVPTHYSGHDE